jgi:hypothetical protein
MLGERQVAAPLMAQRPANGALSPDHRRFQSREGVGVHLGGLGLGGEPRWPAPGQLGQETPVLLLAFIAPAASRPGQHRAMRRQRGGQVAPCGHVSTVRQRFLRLVLRDVREERRWTSEPERTPVTPLGQHPAAAAGSTAPRMMATARMVFQPARIMVRPQAIRAHSQSLCHYITRVRGCQRVSMPM